MTLKSHDATQGLKLSLLIALTLASAPHAQAAGIDRRFGDPPGRILQSVELPAGTQTLFLSGLSADPLPGKNDQSPEDYGDTETQALSALGKIEAILKQRGYQLQDVVKLTVYLVGDPHRGGKLDFDGFNRAFDKFFRVAKNPNSVARTTVQVAALAWPPLLIEIEAMAARAPQASN
jgi:2-iminobutanoate/2-iminopropanoate deaminase